MGPQQGRKVFTLQSLPDCSADPLTSRVGKVAGFSLHAGVAAGPHERAKLERLCRYIARPALSTKRLSMTRNGQVRYELKTPYANGTTHVIFEPLDFISRLVALIPKPRVNLTRFHGVFAPNSHYRARVTPDYADLASPTPIADGDRCDGVGIIKAPQERPLACLEAGSDRAYYVAESSARAHAL